MIKAILATIIIVIILVCLIFKDDNKPLDRTSEDYDKELGDWN